MPGLNGSILFYSAVLLGVALCFLAARMLRQRRNVSTDAHATPAGVPGLDVSNWQRSVDWQQVRAAGRVFAFIKASEGGTWVDPWFARNWAQAKDAGVWRGAYHFFRPHISVEEQISNFVATVGSLEVGDLPPVLDLEVPADWMSIPQAERIDKVLQWLHGVWQRLGVKPIIYMSASFAGDVLASDPRLAEFPLWLAHYGPSELIIPRPWTRWTLLQYTETGSVEGVRGHVDLDVFDGSVEELAGLRKQ